MKKLCIFTNVYGDSYQEFIPLYIYSIIKSYPEYFVYIKLDRKLNENVQKQLDILPFSEGYKIEEGEKNLGIFSNDNISDRSKLNGNATWITYEEFFSEFEYLYIGDIDVFICKENPPLLTQHIEHCKVLNLPYSNFVRSQYMKSNKNWKLLLRIFLGRGLNEAKAWSKMDDMIIKRLTGLHFVKVEEYFSGVKPYFEKYIDILNRVERGEGTSRENMYLRSNEILLYDLIKDSGLGLPPVVPNNYSELPSDYKSLGFRPIHGIHLGIFRSESGPLNEFQTVSSDMYINFYRQFCDMRSNDTIYQEMQKHHKPYLIKIINQMDYFYNDVMNLLPSRSE